MTAAQFSALVHGKKVTRGKYVARCPSHHDKHPSLSIAEGKKGVVIRCMSNGCETLDILKALGLGWSALFDGRPTREIMERLTLQDQRESLERQLGLVMVLGAVEKGKRAYWSGAEQRIRRELAEIRCRIEPEIIYKEYQQREFAGRLARLGWGKLWEGI